MSEKTSLDARVEAVKTEIKEAQNAARHLGKMFMISGRNRWIDISLEEGWAYNAEERARGVALDVWRNTRALPTLEQLDRLVAFNADDHKYFKSHGRDLMPDDRQALFAARKKITDRSRRMMGDAE